MDGWIVQVKEFVAVADSTCLVWYLGLIKFPGGDGQSADGSGSSLVRAKGAKWKSMLGRMDRVDEFEGYKAQDDDDWVFMGEQGHWEDCD